MLKKPPPHPQPEETLPRPLLNRWLTPTFAIVGLGLLVRLVLMPLTYHVWDLPSLAFGARIVARGDLNVYDTGLRLWVENGWNRPEIVSPVSHGPFFYYVFGGWLWLANLLKLFPLDSFSNGDPGGLSALNIAVLKVPYLVFDLAAAFFLAGIFHGWQKRLALGLWLLAPLPIFAFYAWGQNDSFMLAAVCAALYYASKAFNQTGDARLSRDAYLAMVALSVGIGFKLFPVFFLFPATLLLAKRPGRRVWEDYRRVGLLLLAGIVPAGVVFVPLALFTKTFITSVLFSWEANLLSAVGFDSGPGYLALFWGLYIGLVAFLLLAPARERRFSFFDFTVYLSAIIFLYEIIASFPAGFLSWLLPFIIIMVVQRPRLYPAYLILTLCFLVGMVNRNVEIITVWFSLDKQAGLLDTGKNFLINTLPWPTVINLGTALQVVTLVSLFLLYSGLGRNALAELGWNKPTSDPLEKEKTGREGLHPVWLALPMVLVFGALLLLFIISTAAGGVRQVNQPASERALAQLTTQTTIEQPFTAPPGKLEKIELAFATYDRYNLSKIEFSLRSGDTGAELSHTTIDGLLVKNGSFYAVKLAQPLSLAKATPLVVRLSSPDGTNLTGLGVFSTDFKTRNKYVGNGQPTWSDPAYNLPDKAGLTAPASVNGQASDQILQFRADYSVDWGAKLGLISGALGKTPLFSLAYYGLCFLLLIGVVAAAFLTRRSNRITSALPAVPSTGT